MGSASQVIGLSPICSKIVKKVQKILKTYGSVGRGNFLLRRESSRLFAQGHSDRSRQCGAGDGGSAAWGDADDLVDRAQDQTRPRRHFSGREIFLTSCRPGARKLRRSFEHSRATWNASYITPILSSDSCTQRMRVSGGQWKVTEHELQIIAKMLL